MERRSVRGFLAGIAAFFLFLTAYATVWPVVSTEAAPLEDVREEVVQDAAAEEMVLDAVPTDAFFTHVYLRHLSNQGIPIFSSLTPDYVVVGSGNQAFTATGSNFDTACCGLRIFASASDSSESGSSATTSQSIGSSTITGTISGSHFNIVGTRYFRIFNQNAGGGRSTTVLTITVGTSPINPTPNLTNISPNQVTKGASGFTMTLTGTNFVSGSVVRVNGSDRSTTFVSSTQLTASILTSDVSTSGNKTITVFNPTPGGGTSGSSTLVVNNPVPTITSISPTSVSAGNGATVITITGTNFETGATGRFNGSITNVTTNSVTSTQVTITLAASLVASQGSHTITVNNVTPGGGNSNGASFVVNAPVPVLSTISPTSVAAGSATFVMTVTGSDFVAASSVRVNGVSRTTTFFSSTQLTATIPAGDVTSAGTANITVFTPTPGGGTSNTITLDINAAAPVLTSISPTAKSVGTGNLSISLSGSNFLATSVVRVNGSDRVTTYNSGSSLSATLLAGDVAVIDDLDVTVYTPPPGGGESAIVVLPVQASAPAITSITPSSVTVGAGDFNMTVIGSGFTASSVVRASGSDRVTTFVSSTELTAAILAADVATGGTKTMTVFTPAPGGGTSNGAILTIGNDVPTITTLAPATVNVDSADTTVTVTGTNFISTSVGRWEGSNTGVVTSFVSATELELTLDETLLTALGEFDVTVFNPAPGGGESAASTFTVSAGGGGGRVIIFPVPPIAGEPYALSPTSIRWPLTDMSGNETSFQIIDLSNNASAVATAESGEGMTVTHIDETGLQPGTMYCHRAAVSVTADGPSTVTSSQMFPCVTTPEEDAAPGGDPNIAVNVTSDSTTTTSTVNWGGVFNILDPEKTYGIYDIDNDLWLNPPGLAFGRPFLRLSAFNATEQFNFTEKPFFQKASEWGAGLTIGGLNPKTSYSLGIVQKDPEGSVETGIIAFQFLIQTDEEFVEFDIDKSMIGVMSTTFEDEGVTVPGVILTYRIAIQNIGNKVATNAVLVDPISMRASYRAGTMIVDDVPLTDAEDGDIGMYDPESREARWIWPEMPPEEPHVAFVQLDVRNGDGSDVQNVAETTWCGDGYLDDGEQCDEKDMNGEPGHCSATCSLCGNGKKDSGIGVKEECDNGDENGQLCAVVGGKSCDYCTLECLLETLKCGDGKLQEGEECDLGNETGKMCKPEPGQTCAYCNDVCENAVNSCGNGVTDTGEGEACDDGENNGKVCESPLGGGTCDYCTKQCQVATNLCGNGTMDGKEECDAGSDNGIVCDSSEGPCKYCTRQCAVAEAQCGDGKLGPGEVCDSGMNNGRMCELAPQQESCEYCTKSCEPATNFCGNEIVDGGQGETCDAGKMNGRVCEPPLGGGTCDYCDKMCQTVTNLCGNGAIDGKEECDDGAENGVSCDTSEGPCNYCSRKCVIAEAVCGDGKKDPGEICDAGMSNDQVCELSPQQASCNYCTKQCTALTNFCGNEVVDAAEGESCDTGKMNGIVCTPPVGGGTCDYCTKQCQVTTNLCGNGTVDAGEGCDLGSKNGLSCDTSSGPCEFCNAKCQVAEAYCGDGRRDLSEACDAGSENGRPCVLEPGNESCTYCTPFCQKELNFCGNAVVDDAEGETCDDGKSNGKICIPPLGGGTCDYCTKVCRVATNLCGNGSMEDKEECDEGAQNGISCDTSKGRCDYCGQRCVITQAECGDGKLDQSEVCDAGSENGKKCKPEIGEVCTYCTKQCQPAENACGNARIDLDRGEECDVGPLNGRVCRPGMKACQFCARSCKLETVEPLDEQLFYLLRLPVMPWKQRELYVVDMDDSRDGELELEVPDFITDLTGPIPDGADENTVDSLIPELGIPGGAVLLVPSRPDFYFDAAPGTEVLISIDGRVVARLVADSSGRVWYRPDEPLPLGKHVIRVHTRPVILKLGEATNSLLPVAAAANVAFLLGGSAWNFLILLVTQPALLFGRRKRTAYGTVFDALTRKPVDLASVRLLDARSGTVVRTQVTDRMGRYALRAPEGEYGISVRKGGFVFPAPHADAADPVFPDVLTGETVTLGSEGLLARNIPVETEERKESAPWTIFGKKALRSFQEIFAAVGPLVSVLVAIFDPSTANIAIVVLQALLFLAFEALRRGMKPKTYGTVRNMSGKTLALAIVRIFDPKYHKLLDSQVTDVRGRYAFIVGPGTYEITASKPGEGEYKGTVTVDASSGTIAEDVVLWT